MLKSIDFEFAFCKVLANYRMTPDAVMQTPIRLFWVLWQNLDRLQAEKEIRQLNLLISSKGEEGANRMSDALKSSLGDVIDFERSAVVEELDRDGLEDLRRIG